MARAAEFTQEELLRFSTCNYIQEHHNNILLGATGRDDFAKGARTFRDLRYYLMELGEMIGGWLFTAYEKSSISIAAGPKLLFKLPRLGRGSLSV